MSAALTPLADIAVVRLGVARRALAESCERIGLVGQAQELGRKTHTDYPAFLRELLIDIRNIGTALHAHAAHAAARGDLDLLDRMADEGLSIERDAASTLVICDEVLAEQHAARANPQNSRPVLSGTRTMRPWGNRGDDR